MPNYLYVVLYVCYIHTYIHITEYIHCTVRDDRFDFQGFGHGVGRHGTYAK